MEHVDWLMSCVDEKYSILTDTPGESAVLRIMLILDLKDLHRQ